MRTMYDSIESTVTELPTGADLYDGYDDGAWPDASTIAARFPGKTVMRTTTNPADDEGDELDVENGDAKPTQAPGWITRRRAAGHPGPLVYCNLATWPAVRAVFAQTHVPAPGYRVASYDGVSEIPGTWAALGAIAKQYASVETGGRNYDVSVVVDYLPGIDPPPPQPTGDTMPKPTDVVDSWSPAGADAETVHLDLHADGGTFSYGVTLGQVEFVLVANDGARYAFPANIGGVNVYSYVALPPADREGTRYFVKLCVTSYQGKPVNGG